MTQVKTVALFQQTFTPAKKKAYQRIFKRCQLCRNSSHKFPVNKGEKAPALYFSKHKNPDIIIGTENWLTAEINDNEDFPPELGYTIYRQKRTEQKGGGVIILVNSKFTSELKTE